MYMIHDMSCFAMCIIRLIYTVCGAKIVRHDGFRLSNT